MTRRHARALFLFLFLLFLCCLRRLVSSSPGFGARGFVVVQLLLVEREPTDGVIPLGSADRQRGAKEHRDDERGHMHVHGQARA